MLVQQQPMRAARQHAVRVQASGARPSTTPTSRRAAVIGGLTFLLLAPKPAQTEEVAVAAAPEASDACICLCILNQGRTNPSSQRMRIQPALPLACMLWVISNRPRPVRGEWPRGWHAGGSHKRPVRCCAG